MSEITLYHGSPKIISSPIPSGSKYYNDLGSAFYCTKSFEIAGRMAVRLGVSGYVNKYIFNTGGMAVLDFGSDEDGLLSWLDAIMEYRCFRVFDPSFVRIKDYLDLNFRPNLPGSDAAIGPMCTDSNLSIVRAFLKNLITYDKFKELMQKEDAKQYVILSEKGVNALIFDSSVAADAAVYFPHRKKNDADLLKELNEAIEKGGDGPRIMDIIRKKQ